MKKITETEREQEYHLLTDLDKEIYDGLGDEVIREYNKEVEKEDEREKEYRRHMDYLEEIIRKEK